MGSNRPLSAASLVALSGWPDEPTLEDSCEHVLALVDGRAVGTARYRKTDGGFKLEPVAVLPDARRRGVGQAVVGHVVARLPRGATAYVHSQHSAIPFWAAQGFVARGPTFHEAGIPHREMIRQLA